MIEIKMTIFIAESKFFRPLAVDELWVFSDICSDCRPTQAYLSPAASFSFRFSYSCLLSILSILAVRIGCCSSLLKKFFCSQNPRLTESMKQS